LDRHSRNCIRKAIKKAVAKREAALADRLLDEMEDLHTRTRGILERTEKTEPDVALRAVGHARKNIELVARLTGKLEPEQQVQKGVTFEEFEAIYRRVTVQQ
jgi:hypothetical protein